MDLILITVDSLRFDYVFEGPECTDSLETLPTLSEEGVNFTNGFSNAAYTKASFLSIMSGTYPWMFGSIDGKFSSERPHVAELLSNAGYTTAGFNTNPYLSTEFGYDRGFDFYSGRDSLEEQPSDKRSETTVKKLWSLLQSNVSSEKLFNGLYWARQKLGLTLGIQAGGDPYLSAQQMNDRIIEWVRKVPSPRFLWIHYMDAHNPFYPHEGTVSDGISKRNAVKLFYRVLEQEENASNRDIEALKRLYTGEIQYLDRCLGELLERLEPHVDLDNSLLVFGSDHGEAFKEHGNVYHPDGALYDENVHVPLIVNGPGFSGDPVEIPVSNIDIVPTLLSAADVPVPDACNGTDLASLTAKSPAERMVFSEGYTEVDGKAMVTNGQYKLIRHLNDGTEELYDRIADRGEHNNLVNEVPKARNPLNKALDQHIEMVRGHGGKTSDVEISEDVRSHLQQLGYDE